MNRSILPTLWLFAVTPLFDGCAESRDSAADRWKGKEHRLVAEALYSDREILSFGRIVQTDEHFILKQPEEGGEFSVFHLVGDSLIFDGAFLLFGRGPLEVNAGRVYYIPEENSVVVVGYNFYGKTIVIPLDSVSNLFSHDTWREYNNTQLQSATGIIPIDTASYILHIVDEKKMFALFAGQPPAMTVLDVEYPDDVAVEAWEKTAYAYGGSISVRSGHNQFAYSSDNGHYVAVYTYNRNGQIAKEVVIFDILPEYTVTGGKVRKEDACLDGLSLSVSKNYIYLNDKNLTLGDLRSETAMAKNGYPAGYTKTIYVSDWEGNAVVKYELDRAVAYCSIDKNDEYLYAFSLNEETLEPDLVRFKLPELME